MNRKLLALTLLLFMSCTGKKEQIVAVEFEKAGADTLPKNHATVNAIADVLKTIKTSEELSGDFPYIKVPDGYLLTNPDRYVGKGIINAIDAEYFYFNGALVKVEGKSFKAVIRADRANPSKIFSADEIIDHFDAFAGTVGGSAINNGVSVPKDEKDRIEIADRTAYTNGFLHSSVYFDKMHTYLVRTKTKLLFLQYNIGNEQANLTVLEHETNR